MKEEKILLTAIAEVFREEWFKENPYHEPEDYSHDYRSFCERRMKALMELIRDKVA